MRERSCLFVVDANEDHSLTVMARSETFLLKRVDPLRANTLHQRRENVMGTLIGVHTPRDQELTGIARFHRNLLHLHEHSARLNDEVNRVHPTRRACVVIIKDDRPRAGRVADHA